MFNKNQTMTPETAPANAAPLPSDYAARPEARTDERKEAKLVVGPEIKIKGVEISDCDTLVVEGRIEATLDSRVLEITSHGVFQGTIAVDQAEIHGRFEGELTVRKQLVIHATGKVSGKIRYAKIKVEEGAELSGEIQMLDKQNVSVAIPRRLEALAAFRDHRFSVPHRGQPGPLDEDGRAGRVVLDELREIRRELARHDQPAQPPAGHQPGLGEGVGADDAILALADLQERRRDAVAGEVKALVAVVGEDPDAVPAAALEDGALLVAP